MTDVTEQARSRALTLAAIAIVSLFALAGCGKDEPKADPTPSPSAAGSTDPSSAATGGDAVSTDHPATIGIVEVSEQPLPAGGCPASTEDGNACSYDKAKAYRFDPQALTQVKVTALTPTQITSGQYALDLTFDEDGTSAIRDLSTALAARKGLMGLLLPTGEVLTAAQVATPIDTGHVQITGQLTQAQVDKIVSLISAGSG